MASKGKASRCKSALTMTFAFCLLILFAIPTYANDTATIDVQLLDKNGQTIQPLADGFKTCIDDLTYKEVKDLDADGYVETIIDLQNPLATFSVYGCARGNHENFKSLRTDNELTGVKQ